LKFLLALLLLSASPLAAQYSKERADTRVLVVENQNWSDIVVYSVRSTLKQRIGEVTAITRKTFHLPPRFFGDGGELKLYVRPIGGQTRGDPDHTSDVVRVLYGGRAVLSVELDLARSFFAVYNP